MFLWRNKNNINTFRLKKSALSGAIIFVSDVYMDYHCGGVVNVYYKGLTFFKLTTSNYYRDNMNCKVTLEVLAGYRMMFHFTDFRTESCCDHLELHDGNLTSSANITGITSCIMQKKKKSRNMRRRTFWLVRTTKTQSAGASTQSDHSSLSA